MKIRIGCQPLQVIPLFIYALAIQLACCSDYKCRLIPYAQRLAIHMYGSREVHFFWTSSARVHSDSRRQSPIVADCRRKSPIVAARRRLSPIRDRKIRAMKKSLLMPCGLRALNVHVKS